MYMWMTPIALRMRELWLMEGEVLQSIDWSAGSYKLSNEWVGQWRGFIGFCTVSHTNPVLIQPNGAVISKRLRKVLYPHWFDQEGRSQWRISWSFQSQNWAEIKSSRGSLMIWSNTSVLEEDKSAISRNWAEIEPSWWAPTYSVISFWRHQMSH